MADETQPPAGYTLVTRPDGTQFLCVNDESAIKPYQLPDPLTFSDGREVLDDFDWQHRRDQILKDFTRYMYGEVPVAAYTLQFTEEEAWTPALNGLGQRKQIGITIETDQGQVTAHLLLHAPAGSGSYPAFLGYNFAGNHTIHPDPAIRQAEAPWLKDFPPAPRGSSVNRWCVEQVVGAGFALGTIFYGDIDPDFDDGFQNGIHPLFTTPGHTRPKPHQWGSIAAWAFGLSRALDYLGTEPLVNASQVAVIGHSRLGKTALWAGASDARFAAVISNNSGCGGAALSKRAFGENVQVINHSFPHWFCGNFKQYNAREQTLPFDQHMQLALIAPRPLYVASAVEDWWSDPRGEYLGARGASVVYEFLGEKGLPMKTFPPLDQVDLSGKVAYHIRSGGHDITPWDWEQYLAFFKRHLAD